MVFIPCSHCYLKHGEQYTQECDDFCDYAKVCLENKKWPWSDITFSYKLESARFNPSIVPTYRWHEYFVEVFDMLRKYEEAANNLKTEF